jgi:FtsH-binding integral membrane protein
MNEEDRTPWYRQLSPYHWFVFSVASAAWFFDCLDQRLFSLARVSALTALLPAGTDPGEVQASGKEVTAMFLVGWGIGGLLFGSLGDRHGRAKMLTITVLIYSFCTGLSFFSQTYWDFALFRFLTGVGIGGVFGLAVSLIAETVPDGARAGALGMLQVLSTIGNVTAGLVKNLIDAAEQSKIIEKGEGWRWMFLVGALPALLVILTGRYLHEPERWLRLKADGKLPAGGLLAPYAGLLAERRWKRNLFVGAVIASTGVIGLWAIGEYAVDIQRFVFTQHFQKEGVPTDQIGAKVAKAITNAYVLQMLGAAVGMWLFTKMTIALGRRPAFAIGFALALLVTAGVYWKMKSPQDAYWMMPLMGAVQLGPFAGFAIYLPELFPSRLRSTGTSFCYNLGRFAAAAGSLFSAQLATGVYGGFASPLKERYAAMSMCAIFLAGIAVLPFAPETKGKPLPED